MINAVGRDIPEEILERTGKEVFQGNGYRDGYVYKKDGPMTRLCLISRMGPLPISSPPVSGGKSKRPFPTGN